MITLDIQPDPARTITDQDELVLMALCLRQEAMGEHDLSPRYPSAVDKSALEEMTAIGCVIMNRVIRRKLSVREVILQPKQFSWLNPGDPMLTSASKFIALGVSFQDSWKTATCAAFLAYTRLVPDLSYGADHYYNPDVSNPPWAANMRETIRWARHRFMDSRFRL